MKDNIIFKTDNYNFSIEDFLNKNILITNCKKDVAQEIIKKIVEDTSDLNIPVILFGNSWYSGFSSYGLDNDLILESLEENEITNFYFDKYPVRFWGNSSRAVLPIISSKTEIDFSDFFKSEDKKGIINLVDFEALTKEEAFNEIIAFLNDLESTLEKDNKERMLIVLDSILEGFKDREEAIDTLNELISLLSKKGISFIVHERDKDLDKNLFNIVISFKEGIYILENNKTYSGSLIPSHSLYGAINERMQAQLVEKDILKDKYQDG